MFISKNTTSSQAVLSLCPVNFIEPYTSFMHQWHKRQKQPQLVGLNFENEFDEDQESVMTLGYLDYDRVEGGQAGLTVFDNNPRYFRWALTISNIKYGDQVLTNHTQDSFIDSGVSSI
mmetsp:Transcript_13124/g.20383  ORF Transcript_13124/g.20383 Transcript_13124/m.20383 type:complete len:118 (+) Transcript_13124:349-702(+)